MTDKELLELAAKAANQPIEFTDGVPVAFIEGGEVFPPWNPLIEDGDALRLAVKLNMQITIEDDRCGAVTVAWGDEFDTYIAESSKDPDAAYASTRRAIVRAAASIGKAMP